MDIAISVKDPRRLIDGLKGTFQVALVRTASTSNVNGLAGAVAILELGYVPTTGMDRDRQIFLAS